LGILTVLLRKPADIASLHVAVGALLLAMNWIIALRAIGVIRATSFALTNPNNSLIDHPEFAG